MKKNQLKKMSYLLAFSILLSSQKVQAIEKKYEIQEENTEQEEYLLKSLILVQEGENFRLCTRTWGHRHPDDLPLEVISKLSNISKEDLETKRISYTSDIEYYHDILDEEYRLSQTTRGFDIYENVFNNHDDKFEEKLVFWGDSKYYCSSTGNFYRHYFTFTPETQTESRLYHPIPEEKIIFHYNLEDYFDSPTITREEAEELINNLNNNLNRTREKLEY